MNKIQQTIEKCACNLALYMEGNKENNQVIIKYALQLVVFNGTTLLLTLLLALLLGIFNTALAALVAASSLRVFTGGHHLPNPLHCLVLTTLTFIIIGKLAVLLAPYLSAVLLIGFITGVMALCLFLIIKNAPVETPNRPIRMERREGLRNKGLKVWFFWGVMVVLLLVLQPIMYQEIVLAIGLGIANQTLSISKILK